MVAALLFLVLLAKALVVSVDRKVAARSVV
jgi:hypothetical protein